MARLDLRLRRLRSRRVLVFVAGVGATDSMAGLPAAFCWDVCLDSSFRMVKIDGGN
jgi:hypothetical protein